MGQLAKQMAERSTDNFGANTEMNPKEECKVIFIKKESAEKEKKIEEDVRDEEKEKKEEGEKYKSKENGAKVLTIKTKIKSQFLYINLSSWVFFSNQEENPRGTSVGDNLLR